MKEFNSYKDYAQAVIEDIIALEKTFPTKEQLPLDLLTYWCEEINKHAEIYWNEYLIGKRESYMFDQDEFKEIYDKAGVRYTSEVVDGLIDEGYVQMGIREDGEIVYSATDKGKQALDESKSNE